MDVTTLTAAPKAYPWQLCGIKQQLARVASAATKMAEQQLPVLQGQPVPQGQWCWAHVRVWVPYRVLKEAVANAETQVSYRPPGLPDAESAADVLVPVGGGVVS